MVNAARRLMPYISRASGVILVLAGAYVVYYGAYGLRVNAGGDLADPVIEAALSIQGTLSGWVSQLGPWTIAAARAGVIGLSLVIGQLQRRRHHSRREP